MLPAFQIRAFIHKNLSPVILGPCSQKHIIVVILYSNAFSRYNFRIPYMAGQMIRIVVICHQAFLSVKVKAVLTAGENRIALPPIRNIVIVPLKLYITCVK